MTSHMRILKIGIATLDEMKARSLAIVRGEYHPPSDEPKVWFTSIESLAQVLSSKNQLLLELIAKTNPTSMAELSKLSKRKSSNLSRTLSTMERYGIVRIRRIGGRRVPEALYDRAEIDFALIREAKIASSAMRGMKGAPTLESVH